MSSLNSLEETKEKIRLDMLCNHEFAILSEEALWMGDHPPEEDIWRYFTIMSTITRKYNILYWWWQMRYYRRVKDVKPK